MLGHVGTVCTWCQETARWLCRVVHTAFHLWNKSDVTSSPPRHTHTWTVNSQDRLEMISLLHWSLQLWKKQMAVLPSTSEHTALFCLSLSASFRLWGNQIILLSFLPASPHTEFSKKKRFQVYFIHFLDLCHRTDSYNSEKFDSFFKKIDYGLSVARQRTSSSFSTLSLSLSSLHSSRVGRHLILPVPVRQSKGSNQDSFWKMRFWTEQQFPASAFRLPDDNSTAGFSIGFITRNKLVSNLIWTSLRKIA